MKTVVLMSLMLVTLLSASFASAFTCASATTCTGSVSYKEPVVNGNGTALDDLKQTVINGTVNGVAFAPIIVPATAATGGGLITKPVTVTAPACKSTVVAVDVDAEDTVGNPNAKPDATGSLTINRTAEAGCEPGPVTNFTFN